MKLSFAILFALLAAGVYAAPLLEKRVKESRRGIWDLEEKRTVGEGLVHGVAWGAEERREA
ncbi:hypothetical protein EV714DRAFT_277465 [Schizophyllum commune]